MLMGKTKTSKQRGARTHRRGKKAGRGHGKRGGVGAAGGHKHKWISTLKYDRDHYGQKGKGFKRPQSVVSQPITINVGQLKLLMDRLVRDGVEKKAGKVLNLTALGYDKLLGSGQVELAWQVTVDTATSKAVEKIESAGGKVTLPKSD
jgi:large subunit ribosomal protein L15